MLKIMVSAAFALGFASTSYAQDTVTWQDNIGGWSVAIDRTIDNSCFIITGFEGDVFVRFQLNAAQETIQFVIASMHWDTVETGVDYDMGVAFDGYDAWNGTAVGHRWNDILPSLVLSVPIADQHAANFMHEFTDTGSVSVTHDGSEIANLALSGTELAVASMMECQASMAQASKDSSALGDTFTAKPDPI